MWKREDLLGSVERSGLLHEELTEQILGAGIEVPKALGPGLLESVYEQCLCHELNLRDLRFVRQTALPVRYKGIQLDCGYRVVLIVEDSVVVEVKAVERLIPVHDAQLLTYLRLSGKRVGLLPNFNVPALRRGVVRRVL